jgi:hypothetical protein
MNDKQHIYMGPAGGVGVGGVGVGGGGAGTAKCFVNKLVHHGLGPHPPP